LKLDNLFQQLALLNLELQLLVLTLTERFEHWIAEVGLFAILLSLDLVSLLEIDDLR